MHDDTHNTYDDYKRERNQLEAERRVEVAGLTGGSGSESGAEGSEMAAPSFDCPASEGEWDAQSRQEYEAWAEEVDEIYAAEELERLQALENERRQDQ